MKALLQKISKISDPFVIILVGPPLSGKTTFIKELCTHVDFSVISRDDILMEKYQQCKEYGIYDNNYNHAWNTVNQKEVDEELREKLANTKGNVVIDMTQVSSKRRKYHLSFFPDHYKIAVVFPILTMEEYERRNNKRNEEENKHISMGLIKNMIDSLQAIKDEEGFKYIFHI